MTDLELLETPAGELEHLAFEAALELKAEDDNSDGGPDGTFTGMASTFGNKDLMGDIIEAGAFKKSLKRRPAKKVKLLHQHDGWSLPLGVFAEIEETPKGLMVKGRLAMGTQQGREVFELMKMGALDALSIGFRVAKDGAIFDRDKGLRIIKEIDLIEISVVNFPANPRARITGVKGLTVEDIQTKHDLEAVLRDAGVSRQVAKYVAAHWQPPAQRDVEGGESGLTEEQTAQAIALCQEIRTALAS